MIALSFLCLNNWSTYWELYGFQNATGNREPCSFSLLIRNLRVSRKLKDEQYAAAAREEFHETFDTHFARMGKGHWESLSSKSSIAQRYRKLKKTPSWWDKLEEA